jgi:translocator protein
LDAAALEVVVLWCAIGATTVVFAEVAPVAAWLMAPYWAWVSLASALTIAYWRLNRS